MIPTRRLLLDTLLVAVLGMAICALWAGPRGAAGFGAAALLSALHLAALAALVRALLAGRGGAWLVPGFVSKFLVAGAILVALLAWLPPIPVLAGFGSALVAITLRGIAGAPGVA